MVCRRSQQQQQLAIGQSPGFLSRIGSRSHNGMSRSLVKSFLIALSETQVITALLCAAVEAYDKGF